MYWGPIIGDVGQWSHKLLCTSGSAKPHITLYIWHLVIWVRFCCFADLFSLRSYVSSEYLSRWQLGNSVRSHCRVAAWLLYWSVCQAKTLLLPTQCLPNWESLSQKLLHVNIPLCYGRDILESNYSWLLHIWDLPWIMHSSLVFFMLCQIIELECPPQSQTVLLPLH